MLCQPEPRRLTVAAQLRSSVPLQPGAVLQVPPEPEPPRQSVVQQPVPRLPVPWLGEPLAVRPEPLSSEQQRAQPLLDVALPEPQLLERRRFLAPSAEQPDRQGAALQALAAPPELGPEHSPALAQLQEVPQPVAL